jgi:hypothetical protein
LATGHRGLAGTRSPKNNPRVKPALTQLQRTTND